MNEYLIYLWNKKITNKDNIYHLGDFCFGNYNKVKSIIKKLNGNIHVIKGNHDQSSILNQLKENGYINWWKQYHELHYKDNDFNSGKVKICLFHFPLEHWNKDHKGSWHLHGHCHGNLDSNSNQLRIDVGVDSYYTYFEPINYNKIKKIMINKININNEKGSLYGSY